MFTAMFTPEIPINTVVLQKVNIVNIEKQKFFCMTRSAYTPVPETVFLELVKVLVHSHLTSAILDYAWTIHRTTSCSLLVLR